MTATQLDAYQLMHEGALAFAEIEHDGFRVDTAYLERTKKEVREEIRQLKGELTQDNVFRLQSRRFGQSASLGSRPQLMTVLTQDLGLTLPEKQRDTKKQRWNGEEQEDDSRKAKYSMDKKALDGLNLPYLKKFTEYQELLKLESTYLDGVIREVIDGFVHAVINLNLATSYRSSVDSPPLQQMPRRNKKIARLIRSAFIPREGHVLLEIDYAALEFRAAASVWRDATMVDYASDPAKDIHGDCAKLLYKISKGSKKNIWFKECRDIAKNKFVFPEIYGDFFIACAMALWESISLFSLNVDGVPMDEHLRHHGITSLGACNAKQPPFPNTFENHVKKSEKEFYEWFPELKERKDRFIADYMKNGYFDTLTGFRIHGVWKKNFILNAIVQGPAFHLVLWDVTQLVNWLKSNRMKSKVVMQIHDSVIIDTHRSELDDVIAKATEIMTVLVKKRFDWVITPLDVELEIAESNWYEKIAI